MTVHHCLFLRPHHSWIHGEISWDFKPENEGSNLFSSDAAIDGLSGATVVVMSETASINILVIVDTTAAPALYIVGQ